MRTTEASAFRLTVLEYRDRLLERAFSTTSPLLLADFSVWTGLESRPAIELFTVETDATPEDDSVIVSPP